MRALLAIVLAGAACGGGRDADTESLPDAVVVVDGLNGPIGVHVESDGTLWVSESGTSIDPSAMAVDSARASPDTSAALKSNAALPDTGSAFAPDSVPLTEEGQDSAADHPYLNNTARLIRVGIDGTVTEVLHLPVFVMREGPQGAGRIAWLDGALYVTNGAWSNGMDSDRPTNMAAVVEVKDGRSRELATTWEIEKRDNPGGAAIETNPFDLTVGPDGGLWLTDAAGNTLYRLDPATGALELRAVFAPLPGPVANPLRGGAHEIEPVPTAVAFDDDGDTYVALLPGLPFLPGSGKVVRVASDGSIRDHATGFTMLTDLVTGPDGRLYGVSIGEFTDQGPVPNTGSVLRIEGGDGSRAILSGLSFPTTIAFAANGDAFLAINGIGAPGSGQIVKYEQLIQVR